VASSVRYDPILAVTGLVPQADLVISEKLGDQDIRCQQLTSFE
jgi:hypothetical protein